MHCPYYGKDFAKESLILHQQTHNRVAKGGLGKDGDGEGGGDDPRKFRMAFPDKAGPRPFPFEGCSRHAVAWTDMQVHF